VIPRVSVIIPTQALAARTVHLRRALESVLSQTGVRAAPIVVVNGTRRDDQLVHELEFDARVRTVHLDRASLPRAIRAGRELVDTPYFATLDDDDVLLPGALALRVRVLRAHPRCDMVITNGIIRDRAGERIHNADMAAVAKAPLEALLEKNWLLAGAWLGHNDRIANDVFDGMPSCLECTYLAIQFATRHRIAFADAPTLVVTAHSPDSVSDSWEYLLRQPDALRRILDLPLPELVRRAYRLRVAEEYHSAADLLLRLGRRREAWRSHMQSIQEPGGWRYLPFTRHLVRGRHPTNRLATAAH
jgi:glycosyltransferase involved in cell wall biosynthesis